MEAVYLTGELARGLDTNEVDVTIIGRDIDKSYLSQLMHKAEDLVSKKIWTLTYELDENID